MFRPKIAGIFLAAGRSSRMGREKLSLAFADGETIGAKSYRALSASKAASPLIAVVRPDDSLDWMTDGDVADTVRCRDSANGMSYSIRAGLSAARLHTPDAAMIALADMPFVSAEQYRRVAEAFESEPAADFVACDYGRFLAPPVLFSARAFDQLDALRGDSGARKLIGSADLKGIRVPVSDEIAKCDVDSPDDWQGAKEWWAQKVERR